MAYIGKTNWQNNEIVEASDMNRIEQGILDADVGLGNVQAEVTTHKADNTAHGVDTKIPKSLATAANQFLVSSGAGSWIIKTVEQIKTLLGLKSAAYTESSAYAPSSHINVSASTSAKGHVQLTNSVSSTSTTTAATPNSVKQAYDKANAALAGANAYTDQEVGEVAQELAAHKADYVSVRAFGATKNSQTIQLALNYAKLVGGVEIVIPSGTYSITEILRIPSNTKLKALGEVVFKRGAEISAIMINESDGTIGGYEANKNIQIEGITFDANNKVFSSNVSSLSFGHCSDIEIRNCTFLNNKTWHDIELNSCQRVYVVDCHLPNHDSVYETLQLDYAGGASQFPWFGPYDNTACKDIIIDKCYFSMNNFIDNFYGKAIGNHSFKQGVVSSNVKINECIFKNYFQAITLQDVVHFTVSNNIFLDCATGIMWEEKSNQVGNWNLFNNVFQYNYQGEINDGRFFWGVTTNPSLDLANISIVDNHIENAEWNAIGLTANKVIIRGNRIYNARGRGIYLYGGEDCIIEGNVVKGCGVTDITIGNNANEVSKNVAVVNNHTDTMQLGTNTQGVICTNNFVSTTITGKETGNVINNFIAGVFVP